MENEISYSDGKGIKHLATRARHNRVKSRYVKKFGTTGSANLFCLTGKQAARYAKATHKDNLSRYGKTFRPE